MALNKERFHSGNVLGGLELEVGLEFHKTIDYDRRAMRKALGQGGKDVIREARRLLSRRSISAPGDIPGEQTGRLKKSIGVVSRGSKGGWIKIAPRSIKGSAFYPAFLFYGSQKNHLGKRANYMATALQNRREPVRANIRAALKDSLVPR